MEGNLLRGTKGGQRGNKGCLLLVPLCLQSPPSVTLPYLSLAGRRQELATAWNAVVLTVAWPACWGLLASIMRGQAPPEQLPTGQSSSSFLRRRPTSMSAVTLTIVSLLPSPPLWSHTAASSWSQRPSALAMVPKVPSGCWLDPGMVGLGGVGGCGCATRHYMPGTATQAAATPVTRAFCLAGHAHAETGNSETGGANRDELLKEAIFGQQHYPTLPQPTQSMYFHCFPTTQRLVRPAPPLLFQPVLWYSLTIIVWSPALGNR